MGNLWKTQQSHQQSLTRKLLPYVLYAIIPLALLHFYLYPSPPPLLDSSSVIKDQFSNLNPIAKAEKTGNGVLDSVSEPPKEKENVNEILISSTPPPKAEEESKEIASVCDYTNGKWVQEKKGPLYNGSSCGTIKDGQNCMNHGRPDMDYLYWKWQPKECNLDRFDPQLFLQILEGKHLAFVGDSMARNQLESLLCMLSSVSPPNLIYSNGDDNRFRRWHFPSHNVNVSVYWSPFLVNGIEKSSDGTINYNQLFFDSVDERWGSELDSIDMVVLSIGHWYLHPAIYHDGEVDLGCHALDSMNCTDVEFYDVFGKAFNTSLKAIIERKSKSEGNGIDVIVTTFSPHHFEGEWDQFGACSKTKPYMEEEKSLDWMDSRMRQAEVEEVEKAKTILNADNNAMPKVRVAALDVTKLAMLRPDGHPGPYMHPNPFADGIKERVQNDCVHWCLPGPIDTWNEIMLDVMKRWRASSMK
ncbi:protein ALTERED XYLOGLUCAN 4-like isoform X1 [Chenopodium quinoa]|uniref:protein ALTERED XYLOGLUCAN 4-like isoform X1 n=1 Tax=Chenopodium quinoa TaxID=63459 RepID=UPI000B76FD4B|nr:protein ALTERED XYLOGLUCAN 4-like isoform X1 [Chenopodium quinoa]